jgi:hypothetical protein
MPLIINPLIDSQSISFKEDVKGFLLYYAGYILSNEVPIVYPNAGYKAYNKRMAFANLVKNNPALYVDSASFYVAQLEPSMNVVVLNAGQTLFRHFWDSNPTGKPIFECEATIAQYNHVGVTSGRSIWDVLSGVNQSDLI